MARFFALISEGTDRQALMQQAIERLRQSAPQLIPCFSAPELTVLCDENTKTAGVITLGDSGGVVLGRLFKTATNFSSDPSHAIRHFSDGESQRIVHSGGRLLIEHFWGDYIAFLFDPERGRKWVINSPLGSIPCFHSAGAAVEFFFSDIADGIIATESPPKIDWAYVAAHVVAPVRTGVTGLQGVTELRAGECFFFQRPSGMQKRIYWDPLRFAAQTVEEDPPKIAEEIRLIATHCVRSWASCFPRIMINLSGGLDSSIVLACLQGAIDMDRVLCSTEYSAGSNSDERVFARYGADRARCRLIERARNVDVCLRDMLDVRKCPIPLGSHRRLETGRAEIRLAKEWGSGAVFTGDGGDEVFYSEIDCISDLLRTFGLNKRLIWAALVVADRTKSTVWSVILKAIRDRKRGYVLDPLADAGRYRVLVKETIVSDVRQSHLQAHQRDAFARSLPIGKQWHAYTMNLRSPWIDPFGLSDDIAYVAPLVSQPLVEHCLRIPTYLLVDGTTDRTMARQAFSQLVPSVITQRGWKGGIEEHLMQILTSNLGAAREMLLDGMLMRHGLLDKHRTASVLSGAPSGIMQGMSEIYSHLGTEAWLRSCAA